MTEQVEIIDGVRAGQHPADHAGGLGYRVWRVDRQTPSQKVVQTSRLGQPQRWDQASSRHEIRIIENRSDRVRGFHSRGVPCSAFESWSGNSHSPAQQGHPLLRHAHPPTLIGGSGLKQHGACGRVASTRCPSCGGKRNHKQVPFSCNTRAFSRYDALNTHQHSWIEVKR